MPKRTRLQKLRSEQRTQAHSVEQKETVVSTIALDPHFKKDLLKSVALAALITMFEIGLYFVYYQRVWERR
ncbi:MAG: hypothetical protein WA061_00590 [Microgenomates group bacterium]